jgi:hypothetical protein
MTIGGFSFIAFSVSPRAARYWLLPLHCQALAGLLTVRCDALRSKLWQVTATRTASASTLRPEAGKDVYRRREPSFSLLLRLPDKHGEQAITHPQDACDWLFIVAFWPSHLEACDRL